MGLKYIIPFESQAGISCRVNIFDTRYNDDPIYLFGGARPFILGEYNNDGDIFKPIRAQQATIEILANASGVSIDDFIADDDSTLQVSFNFGNFAPYWVGYISQEDMQETWVDGNHILVLRADDGYGRLKDQQLQDNSGNKLIGSQTFLNFLTYAAADAAVNLSAGTIVNHLFYEDVDSGDTDTVLDQTKLDARTFENEPGQFNTAFEVIEKINKGFNMMLCQYRGSSHLLRIPDLMVLPNLVGFSFDEVSRTAVDIDNTAAIGPVAPGQQSPTPDILLIQPAQLKYYNKPSKQTTIKFDWDLFAQVVCNETFSSGTFINATGLNGIGAFVDGTGIENYTVDSWTYERGTFAVPLPGNRTFARKEFYEGYKLTQQYVQVDPEIAGDSWIRSCNIYVSQNDIFTLSFDNRYQINLGGTGTAAVAYVLLYADDATYYTLDDDGLWYASNSTFTTNVRSLQETYNNDWNQWRTSEFKTSGVIKTGYIQILLYVPQNPSNSAIFYSDLELIIEPEVQKNRKKKIKGDYDRYTISKNLLKNYEETTPIDDGPGASYKGTILRDDGITMTGDRWWRKYNFNGIQQTPEWEALTFKRQKALAHWYFNNKYRIKFDGNFYGLTFKDENDNEYPIGIPTRFTYSDGSAPEKEFMIANLKEIDFMANTWQATLVEVYDADEDIATREPGVTDVHTFDFYF